MVPYDFPSVAAETRMPTGRTGTTPSDFDGPPSVKYHMPSYPPPADAPQTTADSIRKSREQHGTEGAFPGEQVDMGAPCPGEHGGLGQPCPGRGRDARTDTGRAEPNTVLNSGHDPTWWADLQRPGTGEPGECRDVLQPTLGLRIEAAWALSRLGVEDWGILGVKFTWLCDWGLHAMPISEAKLAGPEPLLDAVSLNLVSHPLPVQAFRFPQGTVRE